MENKKISRRELNKEKVIKFALETFIKSGIESSKVSDIANQAGLTERSAFRYFETKADLVLETAMLFWNSAVKNITLDLENKIPKNASGIEKIKYVITRYVDLFYTSKKELLFVQEAEVYLKRNGKDKLLNNKPPKKFSVSTGPLSTSIREGMEDGTVKNTKNVEYLYYNTYDSLLGLMQKIALNDVLSEENEAKIRLNLFIDTLVNSYKK